MKRTAFQKIKDIAAFGILFLVLVPTCAVIMDKNDPDKFLDTVCLMAAPFILFSTYIITAKSSEHD
jgi:hypothetical protein